jgi:AcrR family transcriptional regulator
MPELTDLAARRGYHHGNLREALIEAARRLTAERGPHGFTMADAARLAGVSASAPYRHFKDRDALLLELYRRGFMEFGSRLRQAASLGGALSAMGPAYLAFAREEPGYYSAMFSWRDPTPTTDGGSNPGPFAMLVNAIAQYMPKSLSQEEARLLGLQVWALSHGVAMLERAGMPGPDSGAPPPDRILKSAVEKLLRNS